MSVFDHPHPGVSQEMALGWYLDSEVTRLVAVGARVLDWYSWRARQISDHVYLANLGRSDQEHREFRDNHR